MAKSTTLSFRGGSVTPGQGINAGDINPLVINRKLQDGTPQQQTYDPLLANQHFDFGRVKFRKNGAVVGSYDPFDSDKDIDLPEDATVTLVSVDAADLNTVLADLLSNAKLPVLQNVGGSTDERYNYSGKNTNGDFVFYRITENEIEIQLAVVSHTDGTVSYTTLNLDDVASAIDDVASAIDALPSDEHGYFNSSLYTTPGDGTTTNLVMDEFRISENRDVHGDSIEFVPTHQEGGVDFGEVWLEPGTYIVATQITLQWVGNPRGTFLPLVANVAGQPFDFSYEHEDVVRNTRIVTRTTRGKLLVNIAIDTDTPPMGVWVKNLEVAQIASFSQPNVIHDRSLNGTGKVADPLRVTPAAFSQIKSIPTSISQFRNGDVIPVDGPNGPAKMSMENFATGVLGKISYESTASQDSAVSGNHLAYDENGSGKKLPLLYLPSNDIVSAIAKRFTLYTGTERRFIEYNFKKGKTYTLQVYTKGLSSYSGVLNYINIRTCVSQENYTNILDDVIQIEPDDYGKQITTQFTPSVDSNVLYVFVNATSSSGYIDIRVKDNSESTTNSILNEINGTPLTYKLTASSAGNPVRKFLNYSFKAGHSYKVHLDIRNWVRVPTSVAAMLALYTIPALEDYTTKLDFIFEISNAEDITNKTLDFVFRATEDAECLYIYSICGSLGGTMLIDITDSGICLDIEGIKGNSIKTLCYSPVASGVNRRFTPLKLKRNHTYEFNFRIYNLIAPAASSDVLKISLLNDTAKYATPDNVLLRIVNGDSVQTSYKVKFTAPSDSNYIYIFSNGDYSFYLSIDICELINEDILSIPNNCRNFTGYVYEGPRIDLEAPVFGSSILTTLQKSQDAASLAPQGFAAYGDYLFRLYHTGVVDVYLKSDYSLVGSFRLGSYDAENHANSACFIYGRFAPGNTDFPLLLVTTGNAPETMTAAVENITLTNGVWSSEVVQSFTLDQSGFSLAGFTPYWGWPCWFAEGQRVYIHGAKYRTNGSEQANYSDNRYIITEFELPNLNTANKTFIASDVIKQTLSEYDVNVTQGGTIYNGKIFYTFGFGSVQMPNAIRVWDAPTGALINKIDLSFYAGEIEACAVIDGRLLVSFDNKLVRIDF